MSFAPILMAVAGGVQAIGAISAASAQASADRYNAQVEQRNEAIALQQGAAQADAQQRASEESLGRIRAAYGAAGIDMGGDALGVYQDSAAQASYDMAKTHWNAKMKSVGYGDQAQLDESKASADSTAGIFNMFSIGANTGASILKAA